MEDKGTRLYKRKDLCLYKSGCIMLLAQQSSTKRSPNQILKVEHHLSYKKMRVSFSVLLIFVTYYVGVASCRNSYTPAGRYGFYPYQYNPSYELNAEALYPRQLMWSLSDIITVAFPRPTISETFTTTATITCTKSVARNCRLNQRPFKQKSHPSDNSTGQR